MKWIKKGLIYAHSATTPTPILLSEKTIRVYVGRRDKSGVSRIGYVDVDAANPMKIRRISRKPVLDIGKPGAFDDNGVILGDVVNYDNALFMYYVGFQHVQKVKFLAFTGLAISRNGGERFTRISDTPVFDRAPHEYCFRAIHSVMHEGKRFRIWYAAGDSWQIIGGKPYPKYSIYYTESRDGSTFPDTRIQCIKPSGYEYRIGRPRVYKTPAGYEMYYTMGSIDQRFFPGYAVSADGIRWRRKDSEITIGEVLYPALIRYHNITYMFYNSKKFGASGFGYAILAAE